MRIAKFIAQSNYCSRRQAERLISSDKVLLNGMIVKNLATKINSEDIVKIDQKIIKTAENTNVWLYYKPKGVITSHHDPHNRPTVFEMIKKKLSDYQHLISVGRLDLNSEGLLIISNNGNYTRKLEKSNLPRKYLCRIDGILTEKEIEQAKNGLTIDGISYKKVAIKVKNNLLKATRNTWIEVILYEGKNREIRKIMSFFHKNVSRLIRISYGEFCLGSLKPNDIILVKKF